MKAKIKESNFQTKQRSPCCETKVIIYEKMVLKFFNFQNTREMVVQYWRLWKFGIFFRNRKGWTFRQPQYVQKQGLYTRTLRHFKVAVVSTKVMRWLETIFKCLPCCISTSHEYVWLSGIDCIENEIITLYGNKPIARFLVARFWGTVVDRKPWAQFRKMRLVF